MKLPGLVVIAIDIRGSIRDAPGEFGTPWGYVIIVSTTLQPIDGTHRSLGIDRRTLQNKNHNGSGTNIR
jgi:hypothetical protein